MVGAGVRLERIRRVTGYLVGTLDRFNDAKKAEVLDRVKHGSL
ncbi:MAG: anaerobic ribonucleoside-triphosphate reductase [Aeromonadales bacterium]|nr:anaerobic ribonucleoside-triphosphate reductase [Aeromonadales bacterium]MDY2891644.1 anaerobic ribonucleoside-triphosphate reductase [Succinivibrio sp.]